jgi:hypothetical protein
MAGVEPLESNCDQKGNPLKEGLRQFLLGHRMMRQGIRKAIH